MSQRVSEWVEGRVEDSRTISSVISHPFLQRQIEGDVAARQDGAMDGRYIAGTAGTHTRIISHW